MQNSFGETKARLKVRHRLNLLKFEPGVLNYYILSPSRGVNGVVNYAVVDLEEGGVPWSIEDWIQAEWEEILANREVGS